LFDAEHADEVVDRKVGELEIISDQNIEYSLGDCY